MFMKKTIIIIIISLIVSFNAKSQVIKGVIIAGANASQVDGDEVYGYYHFGANVGLGAIIPFTERWSVSIETLFNQKGGKGNFLKLIDSLGGLYKINLNYVEVPVLIHFEDKKILNVGVGISWSRLVGVKEWQNGKQVNSTSISGPYTKNDFNIIADVSVRLYRQLKLNFRFSYSFIKIRERTYSDLNNNSWTRKQYNNMLTLRLLYVFNEKFIKNEKKQGETLKEEKNKK